MFFGRIVRLIERENNAMGDIFFAVALGDELKNEAMLLIILLIEC